MPTKQCANPDCNNEVKIDSLGTAPAVSIAGEKKHVCSTWCGEKVLALHHQEQQPIFKSVRARG